jgi:hypothetical protein
MSTAAFNSSAAAYQGRTVDVLAFQGAAPASDVQLSQVLAQDGHGGQVCTGIQKLAQRVLIEFLTEQGTLVYLPQRGCTFMTLLRLGQLRTTLDAMQAFALAVHQVKANLIAEEDASMPADERYSDVVLLAMTVTADLLSIRMNVVSRAGTARVAILPISTPIGP